jgi:hypothetical protein
MRIISIIIVATIYLVSCSKLNVTPESQLTTGNFPKTDNDAISAVNGVYVPNASFSSEIAYLVDLPGDATQCGEAVTTGGGAELGINSYGPLNSDIDWAWQLMYQGIQTANTVIDAVSVSSNVSQPLKSRIVNEAKFLRALYYFYTVQLFGDAPLILHPTQGQHTTRDSVNGIYTQIVKDLKDATALPQASSYSGTDKGRASSGAAYGLLSKVYLVWAQVSGATSGNYQQKLTLAAQYADSVTGYVLNNNYLDAWDINKRDGAENLFEADHLVNQFYPGDGFNHLCHCAFVTGFSQETPHLIISDTVQFYDNWDGRDQRKAGTYAKFLFNPLTDSVFRFYLPRYRKYIDTTNILTSASTRQIDRTILRYADVLLIKAEALNELNNGPTASAYDAINQVRRRAYLKYINANSLPLNSFDFNGLSYAQFRDSLRQERLHEFTYEQSRWFDLVRWRILIKTLKNVAANTTVPQVQLKGNVSLKHYRFPIPQSQRNLNPTGLWQNYGYDGSTASPYDASYQ